MRSLNLELLPPGHEELLELRNQLQTNSRLAKKVKSTKPEDGGVELIAESTNQLEQHSFDFSHSLDLIITTLTDTTEGSTINSASRLVPSVLALEVLTFLLNEARISSTDSTTSTTIHQIFNDVMLVRLANILWAAWDAGPSASALLKKVQSSLAELLSLSIALSSNAAPLSLLQEVTTVPLLTKRCIAIFEAILVNFDCDHLVSAFQEESYDGILRRFTLALGDTDEVAVISGRVMFKFIKKVWKEKGTLSEKFWVPSIAEALRSSDKGRSNIRLYLLPSLFLERKTAFKDLIESGTGEADSAGAVAIMTVANNMGLIQLGGEVSKEEKFIIPTSLIESCIYHSSPTIRCAALSLLTFSTTPSLPIPSLVFPLLKKFYTYSMGEEDGDFRMQSIAFSGKLLLRLRDSSWKVERKGKDLTYVAEVKEFVSWWAHELIFNLNPAKPFRVRMNALRFLDMLLQSHLDSNFGERASTMESYSSYRKVAPTPFSARHKVQRNVGTTASSTIENPEGLSWPFTIALVTPESTFTLLRLLLSTYTALRALSISLLERFSSLPGYDGVEGTEKMRHELLEPALLLSSSGRESEATAGAAIISLIYKRVLQGDVSWDLAEIGGWANRIAEKTPGPVGLSFLNDLMDLADSQIVAHASDLSQAASSVPMHGTLLSIRHLFLTIPISAYATISTFEERRVVFSRALALVEKVWEVTKVVLASSAPEGSATVDTEEARALVFTDGDIQMDAIDEKNGAGSGGAKHKIILSASWRAMKEAGELLETILRLPTELGVDGFKEVWTIAEIRHIGDLWATWLTEIRHRGCLMGLHPCYLRTTACLSSLSKSEWSEVQALPVEWLNNHLDAIVSKKINITRRSAGLPYCILSCLTSIAQVDRKAFAPSFIRLLEIAESKDPEILDESRVHAMNTLRTIFLEAKASIAVAPFIERAYLLSISLFWSDNWIIRNVAMILYGTLVTRSFGRKINLGRDNASLIQRVTADDFFARYPALHPVLLSELVYASREHLDDLPAIDLQSSLFSVLMIISLLQTLNGNSECSDSTESLSDPFIPIIRSCARSKVWKIRDKAADALTGVIASVEVGTTCIDILLDIEVCDENELHGRLVQVLRLLEASGSLSTDDIASVSTRLDTLAVPLLDRTHSFSTRTTFIHVNRVFATLTSTFSPTIKEAIYLELAASRSWTTSGHLPSAENFVTAAFELVLIFDPYSETLFIAGMASPYLSVQRHALSTLEMLSETVKGLELVQSLAEELLSLSISSTVTANCRVQALEVVSKVKLEFDATRSTALLSAVISEYGSTSIIPLKEALLPLLGKLVAQFPAVGRIDEILALLETAAGVDESIESRESAAATLLQLQPIFKAVTKGSPLERYARLVSKLVSDDDFSVREEAQVVAKKWSNVDYTERKSLEMILNGIGPTPLSQMFIELAEDTHTLNKPSSLLFVIEKPNIHVDDLFETEYLQSRPSSSHANIEDLLSILASLSSVVSPQDAGPLGIIGNNLVCKWSYRIITALDLLQIGEQERIEQQYGPLLKFMRKSFAN